MLLVQMFSVLLPVSSVGAVTRPPDDLGELYDEVIKYQTVAALGNCMGRDDQDPGDNKIPYANAVSGDWFNSGYSVFVGHLAGGKSLCNDIVRRVAQYAGMTNIELLCTFVPATKDGEATCGVQPGIEDYSFAPLDFEFRNADGDVVLSGSGYATEYYIKVVMGKLGMTAANALSGAAKYYMYLQAFLDYDVCRTTTEYTNVTGWRTDTISILAPKVVQYIPVEGVPPITDGVAMQSRRYYFNDNPSGTLSTRFIEGKAIIPVTGLLDGWGRGVATRTSRVVIGTGTSEMDMGDYTVAAKSAGTYKLADGATLYNGNKPLIDLGIWGGSDLAEDNSYKFFSAEFMDCQALANAVNEHAPAFDSWQNNKTVDASTINDIQGQNPEEEAELTTSCAIPSVGWIVCPIMNFLGSVTDGMYGIISSFLTVNASLIDTDSGTYRGWSVMRNLANVVLVVVFLIIIFSQLTSFGINNYGIKKMLPRLVVAAILINVSFFVAQIAVDVSNILGVSLQKIMTDLPVFDANRTSFWSTGGGEGALTNVVGQVLAGGAISIGAVTTVALAGAGAAYFGGVGLLLMIILSAVLAVAITFLILAARMALVVVLVVVAPLAFAAMVLPNTKNLYDKWQKMFVGVLVVFPMIAVVYGGAQLASEIIIQNAGNWGDFPLNLMMYLLGIGVALVPLFATIPLLKGSLNAVPAIGKFAQRAAAFNPLKGGVRKGLSGAAAAAGSRARLSALQGDFGRAGQRFARGRSMRQQRNAGWTGDIQREEAAYVADNILSEGSGASLRDKASAVSSLGKLKDEEVSNVMALDKHEGKTAAHHLRTISDPSATAAQRIAAIRGVGEIGGIGDVNNMARASSLAHLGVEERQAMASVAAAKMGVNNPAFGGKSIGEITSGEFNADASYLRYVTGNDFNAQSFLAMHDAARTEMLKSIQASNDQDAKMALANIHTQIANNADLKAKTNDQVMAGLLSASSGGGASFSVDHSSGSGTSTGGSTGFNVN